MKSDSPPTRRASYVCAAHLTKTRERFLHKRLYSTLLLAALPFSSLVCASEKTLQPVDLVVYEPPERWVSYSALSNAAAQVFQAPHHAWQKVPEGTVPYLVGCAVGCALAWGKNQLISRATATAQAHPVVTGVTAAAAAGATVAARYFENGVYVTDQIVERAVALPDMVTETVSQYKLEPFRNGVSLGYDLGTGIQYLNDLRKLMYPSPQATTLAAAEALAEDAQSQLSAAAKAGGEVSAMAAALKVPAVRHGAPNYDDFVNKLKTQVFALSPEKLEEMATTLAGYQKDLYASNLVDPIRTLAHAKAAAIDAARVYETFAPSIDVPSPAALSANLLFDYWMGAGIPGEPLSDATILAVNTISPLSDTPSGEPGGERAVVSSEPPQPPAMSSSRPISAPDLDRLVSTEHNQLVVFQPRQHPITPSIHQQSALPTTPAHPTNASGANDPVLDISASTDPSKVPVKSSSNELDARTPVSQSNASVVALNEQVALSDAPVPLSAPQGAPAANDFVDSNRVPAVAQSERDPKLNQEPIPTPNTEQLTAPLPAPELVDKEVKPLTEVDAEEAPKDTDLKEIKPKDKVLEETAPEETDPEETDPEETAPEETDPEETHPEDNAAAGNDAPEDTSDASQTEAPAEDVQQTAMPMEQVPPPVLAVAPAPVVVHTPIRPEAGAYNSNARAANTMFQMSMNDRMAGYISREDGPGQGSAWIRYSGSHSRSQDSTGQLQTKGDQNMVMMGVDMLKQFNRAGDQVSAGVMGGYGHYAGDTRSNRLNTSASGKVDGHGVGVYATYQTDLAADHGIYADSWLLWNRFDNRVKGKGGAAQKYDAHGVTASVEFGYNLKLGERDNVKYLIQPRTQAIYQDVRSRNLRQADGARVKFQPGSRVQTTVGVRAAAQIRTGLTATVTPHVEVNWLHTTKGYSVAMDEVKAEMNSGRNIGQLKLGIQGELHRNVSLDAGLFHNRGTDRYRETGGNISLTYRF